MSHLIRMAATALLAVILAAPGARAETDKAAARAVTQELLSRANQALATGDNAALRDAIGDAFDFDVWVRFLTAPRADRFKPDELAGFRVLLPGYLAYLYSEQFDRGLATPPEVGEARPARGDVLVSATFQRANGDDLPVEWRLRGTPDGPRVIDVMVGGTSFLLLKRAEFLSIIDRGGVGSLLTFMENHAL